MKNCWEVIGCRHQAGGSSTGQSPNCPTPQATDFNGINRGRNGGRYCWRVSGTFCDGHRSGPMATKAQNCGQCPFFHRVVSEEGVNFVL